MTDLVGHILLFTIIGAVFLLVPLVIGYFVRPNLHTAEKDAVYECGEPTIGSSYIQFDLRFYVVALLFIIFDVEVAFFFPWSMVYGGATQLADTTLSESARVGLSEKVLNQAPGTLAAADAISSGAALKMATVGLCDILVFFGVLLVGFAYVWKRGDLDWVRALTQQARSKSRAVASPSSYKAEQAPKPQTVA